MNGVGGRVQILRGVVLAAALASACGDARLPDLLLDRCDDCRLLLEPLAILAGDGRNAPLILTVDEAREAYRYYLDVIDLERGRLSGRLAIEDRFVGGLLDGNRIYTLEAGADHEMYIQVWRVRLIGATPTNAYGARTASPPLTSDDPQYSRGGSPG